MIHGEYELQIYKYQPLAYWRLSSASTSNPESSSFKSSCLIDKDVTGSGGIPIVYSLQGDSSILFQNDILFIDPLYFNQINVASLQYDKQPFTINFWYKNLNNHIDQQVPIFTLGEEIALYTKNGCLVLNFLGEQSVIEIDDYRILMNISIIYDGNSSTLLLNGKKSRKISIPVFTFDSSPAIQWIAGSQCQMIIQGISIFGYALSEIQAQYLYSIGASESPFISYLYGNVEANTINYNLPEISKTLMFDIDPSSSILRNCFYRNGQIFLSQKKYSYCNGTAAQGTGGYIFPSGSSITVPITKNDIDFFNSEIKVVSDLYDQSGTVLDVRGENNIRISILDNTISLYVSENEILSETLQVADSYVSVQFINKTVNLDVSGRSLTSSTVSPSEIIFASLGNNLELSDAYSGKVSEFTVNYIENPLQIGIYSLDLSSYNYGASSSFIKPIYDGTVILQTYIESGTTGNYLELEHSGGVQVMKFLPSNTKEEYYSCQNGISLFDGSQIVDLPINEDTPVLIAIRLFDDVISSDIGDLTYPKISRFKIFGYSNSTLFINEIDAEVNGTGNDFPYNLPTRLNKGLLCKNDFSISNIDYSFTDLMFEMNLREISDQIIVTINSAHTLEVIRKDSNFYTLKLSSGGSLFVNGEQFMSTQETNNLSINDRLFVRISMDSDTPLDLNFSAADLEIANLAFLTNLAGKYDNYLNSTHTSLYSPRINYVDDLTEIALTDDIIVKAFTSNIILST